MVVGKNKVVRESVKLKWARPLKISQSKFRLLYIYGTNHPQLKWHTRGVTHTSVGILDSTCRHSTYTHMYVCTYVWLL